MSDTIFYKGENVSLLAALQITRSPLSLNLVGRPGLSLFSTEPVVAKFL